MLVEEPDAIRVSQALASLQAMDRKSAKALDLIQAAPLLMEPTKESARKAAIILRVKRHVRLEMLVSACVVVDRHAREGGRKVPRTARRQKLASSATGLQTQQYAIHISCLSRTCL